MMKHYYITKRVVYRVAAMSAQSAYETLDAQLPQDRTEHDSSTIGLEPDYDHPEYNPDDYHDVEGE